MLKNYRENPPTLLTIFAVFGLAIIVLCGGANPTNAQTNRGTYLDFTGDGKTDWAVMATPQVPGHPYTWKILGNPASSVPNAAFIRIFDYGLAGDDVIPGDYTGDRKTELVVYRRGTPGIFYVAQFPIGTGGITLERVVRWGAIGDILDQGDYDGDGKLDFTVVRGLTWYILSSSTNTMRGTTLADVSAGYAKGSADFTGDGRDELVFVNFNTYGGVTYVNYYVCDAITGAIILTRQWGSVDDSSVPFADYTGDGKADIVVIRRNISPMVWYILDPATNTATATPFGIGLGATPDDPVRGDYDGDGRQDIAVWRRTNQTFYVLRSSDGGLTAQTWGDAGDVPISLGSSFAVP